MKSILLFRGLSILAILFSTIVNCYGGSAVTGKIIINGREYSSSGDSIIRGNRRQKVESRSLKPFNAIVITSAIDLNYTPGRENRAAISADENLLAVIQTEVADGVLRISSNRSFSSEQPIKIDVMAPTIHSLKVEGTGDVHLNALKSARLELEISGTSTLFANGSVRDLYVSVSGNANLNLRLLNTRNATIDVEGVAEIEVAVSNELVARLDGVGDVVYYGHPRHIKKHISGVGDVVSGD